MFSSKLVLGVFAQSSNTFPFIKEVEIKTTKEAKNGLSIFLTTNYRLNNYNKNFKESALVRYNGDFRGSPRGFGEQGNMTKYRREQGNISQFLGTGEQNSKNYSTKTF